MELDGVTESDRRQTAREEYRIGTMMFPWWHPVYRDECNRMNAESQGNTLPRTLTAGAGLKKRKDRG